MEAVKEWPSRCACHITMGASQGALDGPHIPSCAHHTILNIFEMWMNDIHCPGLHGWKLFESSPADALAAQLHEYWIVHWMGCRFHDRHICHDSTILFSLFMPTFFFLVYFTLSHVTLLSHGSHVQSHDGSPDLSHDQSHDHRLFLLRTWVTMTLYLCFIYS